MPRTIFYGNVNVPVTIQPNIGLDAADRQSVVEILNILLADETVLSLKTRRVDEETSGTDHPAPHPLYEAQYKQIDDIGSEIVERINILGGLHISDSDGLIDLARIDGKFVTAPGVISLLADHEAFIRFLREDARKCSEMYEDLGTFALLINILQIHEKIAWMLRSSITLEQSNYEK